MRVLVLRAEPSASETAEKLRALGHTPVIFSMSSRMCIPDFDLSELANASGFIFTSINALRCLSSHQADTDNAIMNNILNKPTFCVGERTRDFAKKVGFNQIVSGHGGGSALVEPFVKYCEITDFTTNRKTPLIYLTRENRTPDLEILLKHMKVFLKPVIIYDMITDYCGQAFDLLLEKENIDVVLFYAKSAVQRFFTHNTKSNAHLFTQLRYGCLSHKIADAIPNQYADQIFIAIKPKERHLLSCIEF